MHPLTSIIGALRNALCIACGLLLLFGSPPNRADSPSRLLIVKSRDGAIYQQVTDALLETLAQACSQDAPPICEAYHNSRQLTLDELASAAPSPRDQLVALGTLAATRLAREMPAGIGPRPLLALLPKASWRPLHERLKQQRPGYRALLLDQPWPRQLKLVAGLRPGKPRLGLLIGRQDPQQSPEFEQALANSGIELISRRVEQPDTLGQELRILLQQRIHLLLALPDKTLFNRQTLAQILLGSYRAQVPLIGFSAGYVRAGAMVALYSSATDVAKDIARLLLTADLPAQPAYPEYFQVKVNRKVADSLDYHALDADQLRMYLQENLR